MVEEKELVIDNKGNKEESTTIMLYSLYKQMIDINIYKSKLGSKDLGFAYYYIQSMSTT